MFKELERINKRPKPFEFYTAADLWTDEHTSKQMLRFHLNENIDVSSRNAEFINRSVEWISSHFSVGAGMKIADFGCGPGLYSIKLAQKQAEVTGIDFSKRAVHYAQEIARREGLPIVYINKNYLEYETDARFDLILMIMCDFCALSADQRKNMLTKFHTFLKPDGSVLLDVYSLKAFEQREEKSVYDTNLLDGFWSEDKYYGFLNVFKYENEQVALDKYTIIESSRTRTIYNWLQYFSPEELEKELSECGFFVDQFYSDVAGSSFDPENEEFAVVGRKK